MAGTTYLITGGAGFVGSSLALALREDHPGATIVALDNLKRRGSELAVARLRGANVQFIHGDVRCPEDLARVGRVDVVIDCAAEPSVLAGFGDEAEILVRTNLVGTLNTLELARHHHAVVVFLSSSRVYPHTKLRELGLRETPTRFELEPGQRVAGVGPKGVGEAFPVEGARTLYGTSKLASELLVAEYAEVYGLDVVIDRCGVLAGPWQMGKADQGFVTLWVARHLLGGRLGYIGFGGTGKQVRDVLHVRDLCRLVLGQLRALPRNRGVTLNVGGGAQNSVSLLELTDLCRHATGRSIDLGREPATRPGDVPWYVTDHQRVSELTDWIPQTSVTAIVEETTAWIKEHRDLVAPVLT